MNGDRSIRAPRRAGRWLVCAMVVALCASAGCFKTRYLAQAARGQIALKCASEPLDEVIADPKIADPKTPAHVKALLAEVPAIKKFGEAHGLKPTKNYREYADVKRSATAWAVTACKPLAFEEKLWHFPIVGSVPYLGFFHEKTARDYAKKLEREGLDVDVRGVATYSTLGWFRDPITSPMLSDRPEALGALVDVVLHESVHATVYLDDQTPFNESLASFVAPILAAEYLAATRGSDGWETIAYAGEDERMAHVDSVLHGAWRDLDSLYRSPVSDDEKLATKARLLASVSKYVGFDVNNATLVDSRVYGAGRPELDALFESCGRDWPRFWKVILELRSSDFGEKQAEGLATVLGRLGC